MSATKPTKICGHDVYFPKNKTPFSAQKSVISKALFALNKKQHALLESPTGTGKTLALLTSTLSWQKKSFEEALTQYEQRIANEEMEKVMEKDVKMANKGKRYRNPCEDVNNSVEATDSLSSQNGSVPLPCDKTSDDNLEDSKKVPTKNRIYFCARTHSQLQQSVEELKNCHDSYLDTLSMCILSSRKNLCVNDDVLQLAQRPSNSAGFKSVDEGCAALHEEGTCRFNNNHTIQRSYDDLKKGAVWDIEDAVWTGRKHKSCPYFVSRKIHQEKPALTFAPYSYLLNSSIRKASGVELKEAIVVFDEAHNIESACREAGSCEIYLYELEQLGKQLKDGSLQHACGCPMSYKTLHDLVDTLTKWLIEKAKLLEYSDMENGSDHIWDGAEVLDLFNEILNLSPSTLAMYSEHLAQVVSAEAEDERIAMNTNIEYEEDEGETEEGIEPQRRKKNRSIRNISLQNLTDIFRIFEYMLRNDAQCINSYKLVILKQKRRNDWDITLNFWCLSAGVVFRDFSVCHSVILTSGTLAPLEAFSAELGLEFKVRVEAKHVIDTDSQVFATAISRFGDMDLKSTYQFHDNVKYQDALGNTLLSVRQASSGGMLVFFPSYGLLDKVTQRWKNTGLFAALGTSPTTENDSVQSDMEGAVVVEPRDGKELETYLTQYYRRIDSGLPGLLLAVCRGKVSEGIDFADEYARTVCIVGIPFPSIKDLQVKLKRQFQNDLCKNNSSDGHISGDKWYCQEAFRAVNQAVGRCIRHVNDFGAILLLDPRFSLSENLAGMSKWVRNNISHYEQLVDALVDLRSFTHANRLKFSEHLAKWRRIHSPRTNAKVISVRTNNKNLNAKSALSGKEKDDVGMSGTQKAFVNMFGKQATNKVKNLPVQAQITPTASPTLKTPSTFLSRLSDFTVDYFVSVQSSTTYLHSITEADKLRIKAEIRNWKLSTDCLKRLIPPGDSSSKMFGVDKSLELRDVVAVKLPCELSYLNQHLFCPDRVHMRDKLCSTSNASRVYPLRTGVTYAISLESWSWSCASDAVNLTASGLTVREVWTPEDGVAYRLLEYSEAEGIESVLLAATVVGGGRQNFSYVDSSWMSIELLLWLFQPPCHLSNLNSQGIIDRSRERSVLSPKSTVYLSARSIQKYSDMDMNDGNAMLEDDLFSICTQQLTASPNESPFQSVDDNKVRKDNYNKISSSLGGVLKNSDLCGDTLVSDDDFIEFSPPSSRKKLKLFK